MTITAGLLATKLHRPALSAKHIPRPHLIERLNEGLDSGSQIVLVSAPAGFGKTTCINEWLDGLAMPVAWLSLDAADDDPARFFSYLVASLQSINASLGKDIQGVLLSGQVPPAEVISATLINEISQITECFLLVLDDFHLIQDRFILQFFENFINNLPAALNLVLLTREDPPLPLARLRAYGRITEIRAAELRFSTPEADQFLNKAMELSLSDRDIHTLEERTEGWIAGLQLAGLSIRNRINPSGFINTLSGSHRFILSYLTEEVLSRQTGDIQSFLLETSILEKLCPDLCDAVTGRNDGRLILDQLENANLFLISLDDERRWYRYHHLFADLLGELLITHQKDKIDTLHSRASRWFAGAGMTSEAIQHALAATDYPAAVHLLEENAMQLLLQGYIKTMNGWMQSIPSEWGLDNPALNLILAWMHIIHGDFLQATPFVERLHALFSGDRFDQISDNTLKARWLALQALLMSNQSRPDNSLELAGRAMDLVPEGDVFDLSLVYMSLASAYRELDDYPRALQALQSIIQLGHDAGDFASELLGLSGLVQMALQHGKLRLAFETASQGIDLLNRTGVLPPISAAVYGALGDVYYQRNEPEKSLKYTERSAELGNLGGFSDAELYLHVTRSRLYQRQGDLDASSQQIHQAVDLMRVSAPAWDREGVVDQFVRVLLAQHHLAEAEKTLESIKFTGDGQGSFSIENLTVPNPTAVQSMNLSARQFFNIALRILLYRGQNVSDQAGLDKGIELANSLIDAALQNQYLAIALEALLLRAQMHAVLGNRHAVLSDCAWAIELAEPEGFISIFVEEGPVIQQALQNLLENDLGGSAHSDYVNNILAACHASFQPVPGQPTSVLIPESGPVTTISDRELDVLRLMAAGFKYEEIAQKLFVSLNTVRSHVKAIYGKLNVNNRTRAIEIARQMGIL